MARKSNEEPPEAGLGLPQEGGEGQGKAKRYSVTIDADLVRKLKILAAADDVSPPDWVNNQLRKVVRSQWRATIDELESE